MDVFTPINFNEKIKENIVMENSLIKAKYIKLTNNGDILDFECNTYVNELDDILNVSDCNFGDLIALSDFRDTRTYIIGKEGKIISNPDYSGSGYLTIPYEITRYLNDAVSKYYNVLPSYIDLRYNDKFLVKNFGHFKKSWNFKYTYGGMLNVKFPNNIKSEFRIKGTTSKDIYNFYLATKKPQVLIKLNYNLKNKQYENFLKKYLKIDAQPKIPKTWSDNIMTTSIGFKKFSSTIYYKGPLEDKIILLKIINNFYFGFNYNVEYI